MTFSNSQILAILEKLKYLLGIMKFEPNISHTSMFAHCGYVQVFFLPFHQIFTAKFVKIPPFGYEQQIQCIVVQGRNTYIFMILKYI